MNITNPHHVGISYLIRTNDSGKDIWMISFYSCLPVHFTRMPVLLYRKTSGKLGNKGVEICFDWIEQENEISEYDMKGGNIFIRMEPGNTGHEP